MTMKFSRFKLLAFFALCLPVAANAITTNQSLVDSLLTERFERWQSQIQDSVVFIKTVESGEKAAYLKNLLGNTLRKNGFQTFRNFTTGSTLQGTVIEISRFDVIVKYSEPVSDRIWDSDSTGRLIKVVLEGQIYHAPEGKVQQALDEDIEYFDKISYDKIIEMERSPYRVFKGIRKDISLMQKIFEPAFIVTSAVVIVYLFFTQRGS